MLLRPVFTGHALLSFYHSWHQSLNCFHVSIYCRALNDKSNAYNVLLVKTKKTYPLASGRVKAVPSCLYRLVLQKGAFWTSHPGIGAKDSNSCVFPPPSLTEFSSFLSMYFLVRKSHNLVFKKIIIHHCSYMLTCRWEWFCVQTEQWHQAKHTKDSCRWSQKQVFGFFSSLPPFSQTLSNSVA